MNVEKKLQHYFLHGSCFAFAYTLAKIKGWQTAVIADVQGMHAVAIDQQGQLYDASGVTTIKIIAKRYDFDDPELQNCKPSALIMLGGATTKEIRWARKLIKALPKLYQELC